MDSTNQLRDHIFRFGLILGMTGIIWTLLSYLMGIEFMVSMWNGLFALAVIIGLGTYSGSAWKKQNGGYIEFKTAFVVVFFVLVISTILSGMFEYLLYTVIDPGLTERVLEAAIAGTERMMSNFGLPEEQIEEQIAKIEEEAEEYTLASAAAKILWASIFYAVLALIIAAIIRKSKPVFEEPGNQGS